MLRYGLSLTLAGLASAANHDFVWTKGFSGQASDQALTVAEGDTITFTWSSTHNVYKLAGSTEYGSCSFTGATQQGTGTAGPVSVTVGSTDEYFACQVNSHCIGGQKLHVTVTAGEKKTKTVDEICAASYMAANSALSDTDLCKDQTGDCPKKCTSLFQQVPTDCLGKNWGTKPFDYASFTNM